MLAAIAIGVVLAGPPVAALNIWLNGAVERQGRAELDLAAQRHMALSEVHIARAVATLEELAARGYRFLPRRQCGGAHVLRQIDQRLDDDVGVAIGAERA